ncbi:hypothetical protein Hanom_Chr06g00530701 [Helianthus anomalus]
MREKERRSYCRRFHRRRRCQTQRRRFRGQEWRDGTDWLASDVSSTRLFAGRTRRSVLVLSPFHSLDV